MSSWKTNILVLAFPLLLACEPAVDACESAQSYEPSVEIGTGENQFLSIEDGASVPMHYGMQGGSHVYGAIRTQGLVPGRELILGGVESGVEVVFDIFNDDAEVGYGMVSEAVFSGDESDAEWLGQYIYIDLWDLEYDEDEDTYDSVEPTTVELTMYVEATDSCGVTVTDSRQVYLAD